MRVRHLVGTTGRLPKDPDQEATSGVVGAAFSLARYQAKFGHSVALWGWNADQPAGKTSLGELEVFTAPEWAWARFGRWNLRWLAPVWIRTLPHKRVDVLHVHVDPNLLYTGRARLRLLHLQTPLPSTVPSSYFRLLNRADAVICCSQFIRGQFLSGTGFAPDRTYVVHNGADAKGNIVKRDLTSPSLWNLPQERFTILYAGAIVPPKGLDQLIHAFSNIQTDLPDAALLVAGSARLWLSPDGASLGEEYEAQVRRTAKGLNVHFLGDVARSIMPAVYEKADIVCVPSVWDDPHPTVVCEAMAAGKPVVAYRSGGIPETVCHGQTGFLCDKGDIQCLSRSIYRLALDDDLRRKMGEQACLRANHFSWKASAEKLIDIYNQLLGTNEMSGL